MKTKKSSIKLMVSGILLLSGMLILTMCTKNTTNNSADTATAASGSLPALLNGPIPAGGVLDTSWTIDQVHCGMTWNVPFQNVSNTYLTGKFSTFNFSQVGSPNPFPRKGYTAFHFDPNNLSQCYMNFWLEMSTFNTGQPGRDGVHTNGGLSPIYQTVNFKSGASDSLNYGGKCGPGYVGQVYCDSTKDTVCLAFDTARFISTSFTQSGTGYIVQGNFTFNHWRPGNGHTDGQPISYPMTIYLVYNGWNNILTNGGPAGKYWTGFTGTTSVDLTEYIDQTITTAYVPQPGEFAGIHTIKKSDALNNAGAAAHNMTYGAVSTEVGSQVSVTINCIFYKAHS